MNIPTRVEELTAIERGIVSDWSFEANEGTLRNCQVGFECLSCQHILDLYHAAHRAASVESVVNLVENIVQSRSILGASPSASPYDLYMDTNLGEVHVCGHEDAFWLLGKAEALSLVLDDMTPNITFEIRQGAVVKARIDTEVGIVIEGFE